jgi:hypothetical protein
MIAISRLLRRNACDSRHWHRYCYGRTVATTTTTPFPSQDDITSEQRSQEPHFAANEQHIVWAEQHMDDNLQPPTPQLVTTTTTFPNESATKPWFDVRHPLEFRIKELLDSSSLHPADLIHPRMEDLLKGCCLLRTLQGLQFGQDIIDRLLVEKRRYHVAELMVFVPEKLFRILLYGYANVAAQEVVAQSRMREIIQLAIEEGKTDLAYMEKHQCRVNSRTASEVFPTTNLFNTYLLGLGNAAKMTPQAALDSEAVLHEMLELNRTLAWHTKPNTRSYTHVIVAYSHTGHVAAGRRAYKILQTMKSVHAAQKEVYETKYGVPYIYDNPQQNRYRIVTPDAAAYTATLNGLRISNRSQELAMDLFYEAVNADGVQLDAILFVTAIRSLGAIIDRENHALKRMDIAREAEKILRTMIQYSQTKGFHDIGDVSEDFNSIYEDVENFENADSDESNSGGNTLTSTISDPLSSVSDGNNNDDNRNANLTEESKRSLEIGYNACLHVWAQAFCFEAAPHCETILADMIRSDIVTPTSTSFNTCLFGKW